VKQILSSKNNPLRHPSALPAQFHDLLESDPDLHWKLAKSDTLPLELQFDGRSLPFQPHYELQPSLQQLDRLASQTDPPPLLAVPALTPRILELCKQRGIAAIDLNGRAWLRAPGLLVDRPPLPGRDSRCELEPQNIFVGKSARLVRALLTDPDRPWTQAELLKRTGASSGLASRIVQHLIRHGYAEKLRPREFRLHDASGLLDAWRDSDRFAKRTTTFCYTGFSDSPLDLANRLQDWAGRESLPIAFTQWTAAWVRHPFTEPVVTSAYVSRLPTADALAAWNLRPVPEAGKLWLHLPDDPGPLTETQTHAGLTLATDAQIYLDLQSTGLRGPEAAAALREWDGFCKHFTNENAPGPVKASHFVLGPAAPEESADTQFLRASIRQDMVDAAQLLLKALQ